MELNKIYQGDCLDITMGLPDCFVDTIITSPPYNKASSKRKCGPTDSWQNANIDYELFDDDLPEQEYQEQQKELMRELVRIIKPEGSIFYNHKARIVKHRSILPTEWLGEFNIRQLLIWDRTNTPQLAPIRWFPTTEHIYWITKTATQPKFYKRSEHHAEILRIPPKPAKDHPAPFPEELVEALLINTTDEGDLVFDPYMGSGTTALVASKNNRNFLGIELNPKYIEVAHARIEHWSKKDAQESLF